MPQPTAGDPPTPTYAERIATNIAQLARLAELGMELAESTARHAQRTLAEPEPAAEAPDGPLPIELPRPKLSDPVKWFDRLARTVNACIKLQTQIIHQQTAAARRVADPRRPILRRALRPFIHTVPDEPPFPPGPSLQEIDDAVDQELQADPDRLTPLTEILTLVCEDLGLNPEIIPLPAPSGAYIRANGPGLNPEIIPLPAPGPDEPPDNPKFFASFFQKRSASLPTPSLPPISPWPASADYGDKRCVE